MTNGERYHQLLSDAKRELAEAEDVSMTGDLWNAHVHLQRAGNAVSGAMDMLEVVSKTAFERVFKEK